MPARLHAPNPRMISYPVRGATLRDVWDKVLRAGPVDPNDKKHVAFLTTTELTFDPAKATYEGDGRMKIEKRTGWFDAKAKIKRMDVILMSYIESPKHSGGGLSKPAAREWQRFCDKALKHEIEHVKKAIKESELIVKELNALRGTGLGETERDAANAAIDDLKTRIYDNYLGQMDARLNKMHAKFDKSTKHGEKQGAKLDTSVT